VWRKVVVENGILFATSYGRTSRIRLNAVLHCRADLREASFLKDCSHSRSTDLRTQSQASFPPSAVSAQRARDAGGYRCKLRLPAFVSSLDKKPT